MSTAVYLMGVPDPIVVKGTPDDVATALSNHGEMIHHEGAGGHARFAAFVQLESATGRDPVFVNPHAVAAVARA